MVWADAAFGRSRATPGEIPAAAVVVWLGTSPVPARRMETLATLRARLPLGATLIVVDHNQPRRLVARWLAAMALLVRGMMPSRARYPVAREVAANGFAIESLRLHDRECVQLVKAVRQDPSDSEVSEPRG